MPEEGRSLILAAALLSIVVNPLIFVALDRFGPSAEHGHAGKKAAGAGSPDAAVVEPDELLASTLQKHAVLVGYGRVGRILGEDLIAKGVPLLVIEERSEVAEDLRSRGIEAISGNAAQPGLLEAANIAGAQWLVSAIPNPFENANLIEHGRAANPTLQIIARAHSQAEVDYLKKFGADLIIVGEEEIAKGMVEHLHRGRKAEGGSSVEA